MLTTTSQQQLPEPLQAPPRHLFGPKARGAARADEEPRRRKEHQSKEYPQEFVLFNGASLKVGVPFQSGKRTSWRLTYLNDYCLHNLDHPDKRAHPILNLYSSRTDYHVVAADFDKLDLMTEKFQGGKEELARYLKDRYPRALHSRTFSGKPKMFILFHFGGAGRHLTYRMAKEVLLSYLADDPLGLVDILDTNHSALQLAYLNPRMVEDLKMGLPKLEPVRTRYTGPFLRLDCPGPSTELLSDDDCLNIQYAPEEEHVQWWDLREEGDINPFLNTSERQSAFSSYEAGAATKTGERSPSVFPISKTGGRRKLKTNINDLQTTTTNKQTTDNLISAHFYRGPLSLDILASFDIRPGRKNSKAKETFLRFVLGMGAPKKGWHFSSEYLSKACGCPPQTIRRWRKEFEKHGLRCSDNRYTMGAAAKRFRLEGRLLALQTSLRKVGVEAGRLPLAIAEHEWNRELHRSALIWCSLHSAMLDNDVRRTYLHWFETLPGHADKPERAKQAAGAIESALRFVGRDVKSS